MSKRTMRLRTRQRQRIVLKQVLVITSVIIVTLSLALVFFINISRQEDTFAGNTMVFESADVFQDTNAVMRGSINQMILGIEINTSGSDRPLKLSSITFQAIGTTVPAARNIENARLWYTGRENNFMTTLQTGQTVLQITDQPFELAANRELTSGKNYFWLTCDIKQGAAANGFVDASCINLQLSATSMQPVTSSPKGKKIILSNIPYFSTGLPLIHQPEAWNSKRDGSGFIPQKTDNINNCFFIQSGHRLMNTKETFLASVILEKNATLKATGILKTKNLIISDGGIYQQDFSISENNPVENFRMNNGANYIHTNDGKLPGAKKYFSPRSNQCLYQYSSLTFSENIFWGNVMFNSTLAADMDISNVFRNVKGNLEIHRTGNNHYLFTGENDTINIGGSLIFSGGTLMGPVGINSSLVINISDDLIMKDGMFSDGDGSKNAHSIVNLNGDVLVIGGLIDFTKCPEKLSQLNFSDSKTKTVYWSQKSGKIELSNVNIMPGKELIIKNGKLGDVSEGSVITVNSGAKLMCDGLPVTGKGRFVLKENATLGIGSIKGINSFTQEGNIQTAEKYFDSRATYHYYTGCTPQQTGTFITSPETGKVKRLTVRKERPSDYVILSQDIEVTDFSLVTLGQIDYGKFKLNISKTSDAVTSSGSN